jgi:hypothetical protein
VRKIGNKLIAADRMNFTVGNIVKRVYHIIREECKALKISVKDTDILKGGKIGHSFYDPKIFIIRPIFACLNYQIPAYQQINKLF